MEDNTTVACKDHDSVHHLHLVWNSVVLVVALPLNLTALGIFLCAYRLRTVVTIYMANLATCDLLFTLALPLRIYYYAAHHWPLGDVPCQLAGSLFQLNLYGSCLFLACINVDRLLALAYPLRARHLRRPRVAWQVCAGVWALIVLGCVPVALAHDTSRCQGANGTFEMRCFESFSPRAWKNELLPLLALAEILGFLLPLAVVLWCSARTLRALHAARRLPGYPIRGLRTAGHRRAVQLLLVNAVIFVVCFVPYNLVLAAYGLTKAKVVSSTHASQASLRLALQLTMLLTCANCLLDPLVYYFTTEGFRSALSRRGRATAGRTERGPPDTELRSKAHPDSPRAPISLEQEATSPGWEGQALRGRGSNGWGESVI
ncbi:lysophosphatidic acid receptor 5-like [Mustelus asterias]